MGEIWMGYWVFVTVAILVILFVFCFFVLIILRRQRIFFHQRILQRCCGDLLEEIIRLHTAGNDEDEVAKAKENLRETLNRLMEIASPDVKIRAAELLAYLEDSVTGDRPGAEQELVKALVTSIECHLDEMGIREIQSLVENAYPQTKN